MKNNKKNNNIIIVLLMIIFVLSSLYIYHMFIKDEKNDVKEKNTILEKIYLDSNNKEITINDKKINLKLINSTLYINDKIVDYIQFEGTVYITNDYALISIAGQCGSVINYAVDENGNVIEVYKNIVIPSYGDNHNFEMNNIRLDNNKIIADLPVQCFCFETEDNKCNDETIKVEITSSEKSLIIKKAN